jgi:anaerobic ribonucleoside-triphosphate reductase activating protein
MLKYSNAVVTFREVPSEVALCINITGCPLHCEGCHSPELWEDKGTILDKDELTRLIDSNKGVSCICFMGGDSSPDDIYNLATYIKETTNLKVCWYSGMPLKKDLPLEKFDYVKTGPYKKRLGGLDSITTNQRFYQIFSKYDFNSSKILYRYLEDITWKFQKTNIYGTGDYQDDEE